MCVWCMVRGAPQGGAAELVCTERLGSGSMADRPSTCCSGRGGKASEMTEVVGRIRKVLCQVKLFP